MRGSRLLSSIVVAGLLAGSAGADVIRLRNGNSLEGDARVLPNGDVEVHSAMGVWTVKADRVAEVVQAETAEERVERVLSRGPSAAELYQLALELRHEGSLTLARRLLERVVALDPNHEGARHLLGQYRLDGRWVDEDEYRRARGEIQFRGEWTSPETAATRIQLETLEAQRQRADAERRLQEVQIGLLQQERLLQQQLLERQMQPDFGIPLDSAFGFFGAPVFPAFPGTVFTDPFFGTQVFDGVADGRRFDTRFDPRGAGMHRFDRHDFGKRDFRHPGFHGDSPHGQQPGHGQHGVRPQHNRSSIRPSGN